MKKHSENKQVQNKANLMQAVTDITLSHAYKSINEIKQMLTGAGIAFRNDSVKKYLYLLVKERHLYSAGRGWYSTLSTPFILDTKPLEAFIGQIRKKFPLLAFTCWNLAQLQSWFHHLPGKMPLFVFAEKDALNPVFDYLRDHFTSCYLNPQKRDIQKTFRLTNETVIIRPAISEEPREGNYATIEKILVDLFIEHLRLNLFDEWEYQHVFKTIVMQYRIDMAGMIRYAGRREVKDKILNIIHQWQNK